MKKCCFTCEHLRELHSKNEGGEIVYYTVCDGYGATITEIDASMFWCYAYEENEKLFGRN